MKGPVQLVSSKSLAFPKACVYLMFLLSVICFLPLFVILSGKAHNTRVEKFTYDSYFDDELDLKRDQELRKTSIPLQMVDYQPHAYTYVIALQKPNARNLTQSPRLALDIEATTELKDITSGSVNFFTSQDPTPSVTYTFSGVESRDNNTLLIFTKTATQSRNNDKTTRAVVELTATSQVEPRLRVKVLKGISDDGWLYILSETDHKYAEVEGWREIPPRKRFPPSRAGMIAYAWGFEEGLFGVVYALCGLAVACWVAGCCMLAKANLAPSPISKPWFLAAGVGLLCFGVGGMTAVLTPPWHGPDEPDHFLTFAQLNDDPSLAADSLRLAQVGHFERIVRRKNEQLTSIDIGNPSKAPWPHYIAAIPGNRSPIGEVVWRGVHRLFKPETAAAGVGILRLLNVSFVSVCLAVGAFLAVSRDTDCEWFPWIAIPIVSAPTVSFYCAMVSNYPLLVGGLSLQCVAIAMLLRSDDAEPRAAYARTVGLCGGAGCGIGICAAANGIVAIPMWSLAIIGFTAARLRENSNPLSLQGHPWLIVSWFSAGLVAICLATAALQQNGHFLPDPIAIPLVAALSGEESQTIVQWVFVALVCLLLFGSVLMGILVGILVTRLSSWRLSRPLAALMLVVVVMSLLVWRGQGIGSLREVGIEPPRAALYVVQVCGAYFDGLLPGEPDGNIVFSFWSSLGWLDFSLPVWVMDLLRYTIGLGILSLLLGSLTKASFPRFFIFYLFCLTGVTMALAATAGLYHHALTNVTSRYLLVAYLFTAALSAEGLRCLTRQLFGVASSVWPAAIYLVVIGVVQSTAWITIVQRYF